MYTHRVKLAPKYPVSNLHKVNSQKKSVVLFFVESNTFLATKAVYSQNLYAINTYCFVKH